MKKIKKIALIGFFAAILIITGCANTSRILQPSEDRVSVSDWKSYQEAEAAFNKIKPYETTLTDLKKLNFDPQARNITILDSMAIRNLLLSNNPSIRLEDLPEGARDCVKNLDECQGFKFKYESIYTKGKGNVFLRLFKFKKEDITKGWQFEATIFLRKNVVVYVTWQGTPKIDQIAVQRNPLGPLTDIFGAAPAKAIDKF